MNEPLLAWLELFFPPYFTSEAAQWLFRRLAADRLFPPLIFDAIASNGRTRFFVAVAAERSEVLARFLATEIDHLSVKPASVSRPIVMSAAVAKFSGENVDSSISPVNFARGVLAGLAQTRTGETLTIRLTLWNENPPHNNHSNNWWKDFLRGIIGLTPRKPESPKNTLDTICVTAQIGVTAATNRRRETLAVGLLGAFATATGGEGFSWRHIPLHRFTHPLTTPWIFPRKDESRLSAGILPALLGLPINNGQADLPSLLPVHPILLPAPQNTSRERVFALSDSPATLNQPIGLSTADNATHLSILAPTGAGKSTLLHHLANGDMAAGAGLVVIDPKGDLVQTILATVPKNREKDIVILDPTDAARPIGFNPLHIRRGDTPELAVDATFAVLSSLWDETGIQTGDILRMSLMTLARFNAVLAANHQPNEATLTDIPHLLFDTDFCERILARLGDTDELLTGFWQRYAASSPAQQLRLTDPVMRRLRQLLSRPALKAILAQPEPRFDISEVFANHSRARILLVPLNNAALGESTARIFGSLVVAKIWREAQRRAQIPENQRRHVSIIIDEAPELLHLPLSLDTALAQARGYRVGFTLVAQFHNQYPIEIRDAIAANTLSKICFRLPASDAKTMETITGEKITTEDFTSLHQFQIYASLAQHGYAGDWFSAKTLPPPNTRSNANRIKQISRDTWGTPTPVSQLKTAPAPHNDTTNETIGRRKRTK